MAEHTAMRAVQVAFVCTGNRARSPLAEALLLHKVGPRLVDVSSFGTLDLTGQGALADAMAVGRSLGVDLTSHRSRPLPRGSLRAMDLVVGFEPSHVVAAIATGGAPDANTFMLLELPELLDGLVSVDLPGGVEGSRRLIERMHNHRRARGNWSPPAPVSGSSAKGSTRRRSTVSWKPFRLRPTTSAGLERSTSAAPSCATTRSMPRRCWRSSRTRCRRRSTS